MKEMNFFEAYREQVKQNKSGRKNKSLLILFTVVIAVVILAFLGSIFVRILLLKGDIRQMDDYLNSPDVKTRLAQYKDEKALYEGYNKYISILNNIMEQQEHLPKANSEIISRIYGALPAGGEITSINFSGKSVSISGNLTTIDSIPALITNLKNAGGLTDIFVSSGAVRQDSQGISFTASCLIVYESGEIE